MRNKILKLIQYFLIITGGLIIVYGTVGAISTIKVPRGGTGQNEFEADAILIGAGINAIGTTTKIDLSGSNTKIVEGYLGIGVNEPTHGLSIYGEDVSQSSVMQVRASDNSFSPNYNSYKSRGSLANYSGIVKGDTLYKQQFLGYIGAGGWESAGQIDIIAGATTTDDISGILRISLSNTGGSITPVMTIDETGDIALGADVTPQADVEIVGSKDALVDVGRSDSYIQLIRRDSAVTGTGAGLGFSVSNADNNIGGAIISKRTDSNSKSELQFYTKQSTVSGADPEQVMVLSDSGKVGIGTSTPAYDLDVYGNIRADGDVRTTGTFYGDTWSSITNNSMAIQPTGDEDDFFSFKTPANRPTIKREGGKFIYLESSNVYDVGISARADDTYSGTLNYEKDNHMMTMLGKNSPLGFKANSDYDDYIKIQTTSNTPEITVASSSALKINAGGANDLLLNHAGGNVGIGTTSPSQLFEVYGGAIKVDNTYDMTVGDDNGRQLTSSQALKLQSTGAQIQLRSGNKNFEFVNTVDSKTAKITVDASGGMIFVADTSSNGSIDFRSTGTGDIGFQKADGTDLMYVDTSSGNLGIGTTSPLSKFSMNSGTNGFRIDSSGIVQQGSWQGTDIGVSYGGTGLSSATAGNVLIGFGGNSLQATSSIFIDSNEKIGIGTTTPAMKFSVQGDALADSWNVYSNIYQGNAISQLNKIKPEKGKKGDWASVDHDTLPDGVVSHVQMDGYVLPTMSIDALAQMNTKAVQELYEINVSQTERIEELEANIVKIYDMLYNNCICEFPKK